MTLLAGDLGGTKTLLGLYDEGDLRLLHQARYESARYSSLEAMVLEFLQEPALQEATRPQVAAIGVAGPVEELPTGQRARITNLRFAVESTALRALGLSQVQLVNDFYTVAAAAAAYRAGRLPATDLVTLNAGRPRPGGALAVLGAGTGLGEALVSLASGTPVILPSEGGHSDFAPGDEVEDGLLRALRQRHGGHVSWERVVCGAGLLAIYEHLAAGSASAPPAALAVALREDRDHAPALISRHALAAEGGDPLCLQALERFAALYGAEAGNLALKGLATGGVYLAGGIAPKILPVLRAGGFMDRFQAKGRFAALMKDIPVHVITNPNVGLLGAAVVAQGL